MSDLACKYSLREKDLMVCIAWKERELEWIGGPLQLVLFFSKADVFQSLNRMATLMPASLASSPLDAFSLFPNMEECIR